MTERQGIGILESTINGLQVELMAKAKGTTTMMVFANYCKLNWYIWWLSCIFGFWVSQISPSSIRITLPHPITAVYSFVWMNIFNLKNQISKWIMFTKYAVLGDFEIEISSMVRTNRVLFVFRAWQSQEGLIPLTPSVSEKQHLIKSQQVSTVFLWVIEGKIVWKWSEGK